MAAKSEIKEAHVSFGKYLTEVRAGLGLSCDDLSLKTRIKPKFLHALEEERWEELPGGIVGRGFVKLLAKELELDEEELLARFERARGDSAGEPAPLPRMEHEIPLGRSVGINPVLAGFLVLVGVAVGVWVWQPWTIGSFSLPFGETVAQAHKVLVRASEPTWVAVAIDGEEAFRLELEGGQTQSYDLAGKGVIEAGKKGALTVLFDGKLVNPDEEDPEAETDRWTLAVE